MGDLTPPDKACDCCGLRDGNHKFSCSVTKDQRGLTIPFVTIKEAEDGTP